MERLRGRFHFSRRRDATTLGRPWSSIESQLRVTESRHLPRCSGPPTKVFNTAKQLNRICIAQWRKQRGRIREKMKSARKFSISHRPPPESEPEPCCERETRSSLFRTPEEACPARSSGPHVLPLWNEIVLMPTSLHSVWGVSSSSSTRRCSTATNLRPVFVWFLT
jgi:hypothetical protein